MALAAIVILSLPFSCSLYCTHNGTFAKSDGNVDAIETVQREYQEAYYGNSTLHGTVIHDLTLRSNATLPHCTLGLERSEQWDVVVNKASIHFLKLRSYDPLGIYFLRCVPSKNLSFFRFVICDHSPFDWISRRNSPLHQSVSSPLTFITVNHGF